MSYGSNDGMIPVAAGTPSDCRNSIIAGFGLVVE